MPAKVRVSLGILQGFWVKNVHRAVGAGGGGVRVVRIGGWGRRQGWPLERNIFFSFFEVFWVSR